MFNHDGDYRVRQPYCTHKKCKSRTAKICNIPTVGILPPDKVRVRWSTTLASPTTELKQLERQSSEGGIRGGVLIFCPITLLPARGGQIMKIGDGRICLAKFSYKNQLSFRGAAWDRCPLTPPPPPSKGTAYPLGPGR